MPIGRSRRALGLLVFAGWKAFQSISTIAPSKPQSASAVAGGGGSYALNAANETWPPLEEGAAPKVDISAASAANYYVVLDGSGSMQERHCSGDTNKIRAAVAALYKFVYSVPAGANLGPLLSAGRGAVEGRNRVCDADLGGGDTAMPASGVRRRRGPSMFCICS